jgi:Protein of unknown function (DUF3352)
MRGFLVLLALLVPLAAGCGSSSPSGPAGAEVAPASAQLFLSVATDFDSEEWQRARDVLDSFPDSDQAVDFLLRELELDRVDVREDLEPALGPETDLVVLDFSDEGVAVGLTQPEDRERLEQVLADLDEELVTREIGGWTAFSNSEANLDRFESERAEGTLAGSEEYEDVMAEVDRDALVQLFVNGAGIDVNDAGVEPPFPGGEVPTLGLSFTAEDGGVRLEGFSDSAEEVGLLGENFAAELPDVVPAGALVYLGANDLEGTFSAYRDMLAEAMPEFDRDLARVESELGVSIEEDIFPLFAGETALYVRPGLFIPEMSLLTEVEDEDAAMATLDNLLAGLGEFVPEAPGATEVEVAGVTAKEIPISPPISLFYAAFDGRLVVTTSKDGISSLREGEDRLADDEDFQDALEQAGVPDETSGVAYVDLEKAIPYVLGFAEQAGDAVPPQVRSNLEPLRRLVVYGEKDGSAVHFAGFLGVD